MRGAKTWKVLMNVVKFDKMEVAGTTMFSWTTDKADFLVDLWREKPCLYVISSPQYADRTAKAAAILYKIKVLH